MERASGCNVRMPSGVTIPGNRLPKKVSSPKLQALSPDARRAPARPHIRLLRTASAALILAYFIRFAGPALRAGFNSDDPMNIHYYWAQGAGELLRNLPLFFTTYQRPMGGVYFSVLYHFFGLDPFPYHVVLTLLLLLNTFLAYRFGRLVAGSELAGGLAAFVVAYHARLSMLAYLPAYAFDVLCFTFYFLALTYYVSRRSGGAQLTWKQTALFLLLYIGALDSKEMAVTLPVMVLIYEAIWHPPAAFSFTDAARWLRREAMPALIGGALTLVYLVGKIEGADSILTMPAYRPEFTWSRYWESTTRFVNTILYARPGGGFGPASIIALAAVLLFLAWRTRRKHLLFLWCFLWIAPLPVTFVSERGGACLYIPLAGWAMTAAALLVWLSTRAARVIRWVPPAITVAVLVAIGAGIYWRQTASEQKYVFPATRDSTRLTMSAIEQVRALQPAVKPRSRIYVVQDPFPEWDMKFILELTYRDRTVDVSLGDKVPLPPDQVERMDYVFTFEGEKLRKLKGL